MKTITKSITAFTTCLILFFNSGTFNCFGQDVISKNITSQTLHNKLSQTQSLSNTPSNMYSFSTYTTPYQTFVGSNVSAGLKWDALSFTIPIGFQFKVYNTITTTISIVGGAYLTFNDMLNDTIITYVGPILEDLCDKSYDPNVDSESSSGGTSHITYTTVGTPGNMICKIQVNNAAFYQEKSSQLSSTSDLNFQIWLYEGTNNIEFHYGTMNIQNAALNLLNGNNGFICGLLSEMNISTFIPQESNMLSGPYANPTMIASTPGFSDVISGGISSGTVYKFTYTNITTGINENRNETNGISIYPNPANNNLTIKLNNKELNPTHIVVYDLTGKQILTEPFSETISIEKLTPGIYYLSLTGSGGEILPVQKIIVTH